MKCPKCGTINGKTNKFCRECGVNLDLADQQQAKPPQAAEPPTDEVQLGEQLFEVMRLYESGDFDSALAGVNDILRANPDSATARSLRALVYERKADVEFDAGNMDASQELLVHALSEYEKIIAINPRSAADREKLALLRARLAGDKAAPALAKITLGSIKKIAVEAIKTVPTPVLAGSAAFILCLMLAIIFIPSGHKPMPEPEQAKLAGGNQELHLTATPNSQRSTSQSIGGHDSSGLKVYTFPAPATSSTSTPSPTPIPKTVPPSVKINQINIPPAKLPAIGSELTIVPESKKSESAQSKSTKSAVPAKPKITIEQPRHDDTPSAPDGSSTLANAIELRNQGKTNEAIATAQQSVNLFQADIDAGRNATGARRGIENARKLISVWQGGE
ncbi:MAG: hypothetical protein ABFD54_07155 [Armatimonadota bacterium]|nr:hypothetical protein [bacterium]